MARAEIEERLKLQRYDAPLGTTVPLALDAYQQVTATYATSSLREDALWKTAQIYVRLKKYDLAVDTLTTLGRAYPASAFDPWFVAAESIDKRLKDDERAKTAYARVPVTSAKYQVAQKRLAEQ